MTHGFQIEKMFFLHQDLGKSPDQSESPLILIGRILKYNKFASRFSKVWLEIKILFKKC